MAWSFKKDLREVEKEYQQLIDAGWTPVANPDGQTYSWVRGNEKYRGKNDPTPGIDAEANALDWFKRGRRQRRLMSEKVTAMLPLAYDGPAPKKKDEGKGGGTEGGDQAQEKTPEQIMAEQKANPIQRVTVPGVPQLAKRTIQEQYGGPQTKTIRPFTGDRGRKADKEERPEVPYFDPDFEDVESPYVYATRDQIRSLGLVDKLKGSTTWGAKSSADIQYEKNFGPRTPFGIFTGKLGEEYGEGDRDVSYEKKIEEYNDPKDPSKGKTSYVLIRNPHYKPGAFFNDDAEGTVLTDAEKALNAPAVWHFGGPTTPGLEIKDRGDLRQKTTSSGIPYSRVNYTPDEKITRALAPGAVALGEAYVAGKALGPIVGKAGKYVKGVFSKLVPKAAKPAAQATVPAVRTAAQEATGAAAKKTTAGAMQSMADDAVIVAAEREGAKAGAKAAVQAATNATTKALPRAAAQQALPGGATRALPQSTQTNFVETSARNAFRRATGQGAPRLVPKNASSAAKSAGKKAGKGAGKGKPKK